MLRLMAFWVVIVPLPIAFLLPMRGGGSLYLLLFGWAMIFSKVVSDLITLTSRCWIFVQRLLGLGAATRGTADGAADAAVDTAVPQIFRVLAMLLVALALAIFTRWENQRLGWVPALLKQGQKVLHVVAALKSSDLQPALGSRVLLTLRENLFSNKLNALFIASLVWNDHSLRIWLEGAHKLTPQQIANMNYVISLSEYEAKVVRSPDSPASN